MRRTPPLLRTIFCVFLLGWFSPAAAITPETGIYWNPRYPGWAIYVEVQRDTLFAILYAYGEDGEPEFFIASGPILPEVPTDFSPAVGLQPIQGFAAPLYRVPSGPCLYCTYTPIAPSVQVGSLQLIFPARSGLWATGFFPGNRTFPFPTDQFGLPMERFNFALGATYANAGETFSIAPDMLGEWVFTDQSDRQRVPWRFEFTVKETNVALDSYPVSASAVYRDVSRNAVMYCFSPDYTGLTNEERQALPIAGCEMRQNGQALFWSDEVSIDEFVGTLGAKPPRSANILRGPNRVLGRRLSD